MRRPKKAPAPVMMECRDWEIGDVVWLTLGGPPLTVSFVSEDGGRVECHWFDDDKELHHGRFNAGELVAQKRDDEE